MIYDPTIYDLRYTIYALSMNLATISAEIPLTPTLSPKGAREMSDGLKRRTIIPVHGPNAFEKIERRLSMNRCVGRASRLPVLRASCVQSNTRLEAAQTGRPRKLSGQAGCLPCAFRPPYGR